MYRWQTLTMARVESWGSVIEGGFNPKQIAAVKQLLWAIRLQHFTEPYVSDVRCSERPRDRDVYLGWEVEDRQWQVTINPSGDYEECARGPGTLIDGSFVNAEKSGDEIRERVHWLLFGQKITPPDSQPIPAVPGPPSWPDGAGRNEVA